MRCTAHTVEPPNNGQLGDEILSMFRSCPFFGIEMYRQGVNSMSTVGRLSKCPIMRGSTVYTYLSVILDLYYSVHTCECSKH